MIVASNINNPNVTSVMYCLTSDEYDIINKDVAKKAAVYNPNNLFFNIF